MICVHHDRIAIVAQRHAAMAMVQRTSTRSSTREVLQGDWTSIHKFTAVVTQREKAHNDANQKRKAADEEALQRQAGELEQVKAINAAESAKIKAFCDAREKERRALDRSDARAFRWHEQAIRAADAADDMEQVAQAIQDARLRLPPKQLHELLVSVSAHFQYTGLIDIPTQRSSPPTFGVCDRIASHKGTVGICLCLF